MEATKAATPRVFLSYSHDSNDHKLRCLELASRLTQEGVDCTIDEYIEAPIEGWHKWMLHEINKASYVLVICTETYKQRFEGNPEVGEGLGGIWEGAIINTELYLGAGRNHKFIPVVFSSEEKLHIPTVLQSSTHYNLERADGYERLYRRLTAQPLVTKPPLGKIIHMPPRQLPGIAHSAPNLEPQLQSRKELFAQVDRLLKANKVIFDTFGPESDVALANPMTDAAHLWNLRKNDTVIPNNARIVNLIQQNDGLLHRDEYEVFLRFSAHASAFQDNSLGVFEGSAVPRFPAEFRMMIESALNEVNEHDVG